MRPIDKKELAISLYWDRNIDFDYVVDLLNGKPELNPGDRVDLYRRCLNSFDWLRLVKIFSYEVLKDDVLNEEVIKRVFPKDLRSKYRYARKILSEITVPASG